MYHIKCVTDNMNTYLITEIYFSLELLNNSYFTVASTEGLTAICAAALIFAAACRPWKTICIIWT